MLKVHLRTIKACTLFVYGQNFSVAQIKVLILEDDLKVLEIIAGVASSQRLKVQTAKTLSEAIVLVENGGEYDIWFMDQQLPDGNGDTLFDLAKTLNPMPVTIICTAFPDLAQAVRLTQQGLFYYMSKPFTVLELEEVFQRVRAHLTVATGTSSVHGVVTSSLAMHKVTQALKMAALYPSSVVLLSGETGTGKEVCARLLHTLTHGEKSSVPFVSLNCAAIPHNLVESEMFGAEKGAYTGAIKERSGLVEAASGGTLFLDEIGELSIEVQAKFLRFLETREYRRVGSIKQLHFTGRLVVATHRDLKKEVKAGRFREDLFYRLDVLNVHLPPLRERKEDIIPLAQFFLSTISNEMGRSQPVIPDSDYKLLSEEPLPGNVREVRNLIERALLSVTPDTMVLPLNLFKSKELVSKKSEELAAPLNWIEFLPQETGELGRMEFFEKELVLHALGLFKGNLSKAAKWLGLSRQQVYRKLEAIDKKLPTQELLSEERE